MNLTEKQIHRDKIYSGSVLNVVRDTVELPNGKISHREICLHIGAVAIIPILSDGRVIMERQFRYAHGRVFFEIPAGKLDFKGEIPDDAVRRELREETGATSGKLTYLGKFYSSPAILDECIHMYMAEELTFGDTDFDDDEFIEVVKIPLDKMVRMVVNGEISDGKTQSAVLKAAYIRNNRK